MKAFRNRWIRCFAVSVGVAVAALSTPHAAAEEAPPHPGQQLYTIHCSACHAVDRQVVGPSLIEIAGLYKDNPDGFVKWCLKPYHKRPGAVEMPSMAHLGEDNLKQVRLYLLEAVKGKKEQKVAKGDPFAVAAADLKRPVIQRVFLDGASPAAIAVAMPGDLSYCFDASECRLRYVWQGGFINGWPYWQGNGSSQAQIEGRMVYTETRFPLPLDFGDRIPVPKFLGYRIGADGLPTFLYRRAGLDWEETIRPLEDGGGILREFQVSDTLIKAKVQVAEGVEVSPARVDGKRFQFTLRWK